MGAGKSQGISETTQETRNSAASCEFRTAEEESAETVISDAFQQDEANPSLSSRKNESVQADGAGSRVTATEAADEGVSRNKAEKRLRIMIYLIRTITKIGLESSTSLLKSHDLSEATSSRSRPNSTGPIFSSILPSHDLDMLLVLSF